LSRPTLLSTSAHTLSFPLDRVKKRKCPWNPRDYGDGSVYAHALPSSRGICVLRGSKPTKNASRGAEQRKPALYLNTALQSEVLRLKNTCLLAKSREIQKNFTFENRISPMGIMQLVQPWTHFTLSRLAEYFGT